MTEEPDSWEEHYRKFMTDALGPDALDVPWEEHVRWMLDTFGRRDPECFWCGATVWMALQGFFSGGVWTTDPEDEGPQSHGLGGPATCCAESPDGEHDVLRAVDPANEAA